jgi:hypothetical protein
MSDAESEAVRANARRIAGFGRLPMFAMAAYLRALGQASMREGHTDALLRTSWPVGLREGLSPNSLPGNEFGIINVQCRLRETNDLSALVDKLTRYVINQLGKGEGRVLWKAGELFRVLPLGALCLLNRHLGILMQGPRLSAQFRFGGRSLDGSRDWGGLAILGGFAATVSTRKHPLAVSLSEIAGRFRLGVTWLEGAIADDARRQLLDNFRQALLNPDEIARP